ncbi:double-strand break repair protein AddB [Chelatococcus asaccharovorans]|uniref:double-strand break repair protein AddB n=1 Tax=Chelatococcus asaccharovorans TaxID=28210 RepID=UPI00224C6A16|nr:double-strand break repair protein AddB [Chelatococcus asaccharovorans]CAH1658399.1 ATP-dependent helicase/nuclease subunit B [Chelatococcus asaccharovorans]CAH1684517.1 ATP-dependent helicase/nuclease subunit B [Chelatococcus asaccharovorans]
MAEAVAPRVFTIAPGAPFLPTLVEALSTGRILPGLSLSDGTLDPLALADTTIFLPTRRAARALTTLLAQRCEGRAVLLPRIVPLGDVDDAEIALAADLGGMGEGDFTGLPPAIGETERRLILTRLVLAWAKAVDRALLRLDDHEPLLVPASPADALGLAGDLARLMDALATEGIAWESLHSLVEDRYSRYYGITLDFLKIAAETWPQILADRGASDPVSRRNAIILADAERLARERPEAPMIVAGSTGSVPATAHLIAAVSRLPQGAVVLPGLDRSLDEPSWRAIAEARHGHPQAALQRLMTTIGVDRADVRELADLSPEATARATFLAEALRPAETTDVWAAYRQGGGSDGAGDFLTGDFGAGDFATTTRAALAGLALVEAPDERSEALAAALAMREALETPGATVALVTPDRMLAERTIAELARWDIAVEDSAGLPLSRTRAGGLAQLVAEAALADFAAPELLALLSHPDATFGQGFAAARQAAEAFEIGLLRGPEAPPGIAGLKAILPERRAEAQSRRSPRPLRRLGAPAWDRIAALLDAMEEAFGSFNRQILADGPVDLVAMAAAHDAAVRAVSARAPEEEREPPRADGWGDLASLFDDLAAAEAADLMGRAADYPAFFAGLLAERVLRRGEAAHRRAKVFGLLEARLLSADRIVLGGLDEGIWPPVVRTDAFLNRPMRTALGMSPPERRIGQTAHDFVEALGTRDAVITRALKREGAPTVPSRFLQRMRALAGREAWDEVRARGRTILAWAEALEQAPAQPTLRRPRPKPPLHLIPRSLSVTEVETLVRDPYAVFAKHVLKLDPLEGLAVPPGAADRGNLVHEALGRFAMAYPAALPADALAALTAIGREVFAPYRAYPDVMALWWPRFLRLAEAYVAWEEGRRPGLARLHAEISGALDLALADGSSFALRGRADRVEERGDGAVIVDFKTGQVPSAKQVFAGFAPQMTLEAAMLVAGGFKGPAPVSADRIELLYVSATGGKEPLRPRPVKPEKDETRSVADLVAEHPVQLAKLMSRYCSGEIGFASRPFAEYAKREGVYDHLARVREWSTGGDDGGGE